MNLYTGSDIKTSLICRGQWTNGGGVTTAVEGISIVSGVHAVSVSSMLGSMSIALLLWKNLIVMVVL